LIDLDKRPQLESYLATIEARLAQLDALTEPQKRRTVWQEERDAIEASRRVVKQQIHERCRALERDRREAKNMDKLSRWQRASVKWQVRKDHLAVREQEGRREVAGLMKRLDHLTERLKKHHQVPRAERREKAHHRERERLGYERASVRSELTRFCEPPQRRSVQTRLPHLRSREAQTKETHQKAKRDLQREERRLERLDRLEEDGKNRWDRSR
jgi:hypothetical protein